MRLKNLLVKLVIYLKVINIITLYGLVAKWAWGVLFYVAIQVCLAG